MNEEQGKPKKWYKQWPFIFTISLVLLITCGIPVFATMYGGRTWPPATQATYNSIKENLQSAVTAYSESRDGPPPTFNGTYTNANCSQCKVVDINALLVTNGGFLFDVPAGLALVGADMDNCNGRSIGCANDHHYIWIVDANGSVYSTCVGKGCETNNSGYQGVWP